MDEFQLTTDQIAMLRALHRTLRDKRLAYRVNAVILLGTGWSAAQVAQALLVDETTVRNWFQKYQQGGKDELLSMNYLGKEPSLTTEQQAELAKHLDETISLDSNAIRCQRIMNYEL